MSFFSRRKKSALPRNNVSRAYIPQRNRKIGTDRLRPASTGQIARELTRSLQPRSWRKHWRTFWIMAGISLLVAGYIFVFKSNYFLVEKIEIVRHDMSIDRNEVLGHLTDVYGQNIFMMDTKKIQDTLAVDFPVLAYAKIYKKYPRTLEIELDSFPEALVLIDPLGQNYIVNEVGLISKIGVEEFNLPIVRFTDSEKMKAYNAEQERIAQAEAEANFTYPDGETPTENANVETGNSGTPTKTTETNTAEMQQVGAGVKPETVAPENTEIPKDAETQTPPPSEDGVTRTEITDETATATETIPEPAYLYSLGEAVMKKSELQTLLDARDQFERETELMVDSIEYYPVEQEFHFVVVANYPYLVKFDFHSDIAEQFEKLKKVGEKLNLKSDPLEYIDLRVLGNKVFYKTL